MIVAGLTGGIATGKSTVAGYLARAGAHIIDADRIARQVVRPGLRAYREVCRRFGTAILRPDGEIDRKRLGDIVFHDAEQRAMLESIVHPAVFKRIKAQLADRASRKRGEVVILDVPLLFESGMHAGLREIIVVYLTPEKQLARLMQRDKIAAADARARVGAQMPIDEKRRRATILIDNSGSRHHTRERTLAVYQELKQRAARRGG
jgi:dephospho-CoA kinase